MDRLNRSMESTHIGKAEASASASAMANNVNMFDSDLLMAIMQGKPVEKCDSGSDNEAEDKISEDASAQDDASSRNDTAINDKLKKAQKEKNHGQKAFKKKDYEKAGGHYQKAIELNPREVSYLYLLAEVKYQQKKYEECKDICSRAIKIGKENKGSVKRVASSYILRGMAKEEEGELDEAKADVEKAKRFLSSIAMVKLEKGQYFEALDFSVEAFQGFLKLSKSNDYREEGGDEKMAPLFKASTKHLYESFMGLSSKERKRKDKEIKKLAEKKQLSDEALKMKDYIGACKIYSELCCLYTKEILCFFTKHAKTAEEKKKWDLCRHLCGLLTTFNDIIANRFQMCSKETFIEIRALQAKAMRRLHGFNEHLDQTFYEELAKFRASGKKDEVLSEEDTMGMRQSLISQGISDQYFKTFITMADFSGNGAVTVNECRALFEAFEQYKDLSRTTI